MNARHGKIARLPLAIREELNRQLQSGKLSPALLPWLNQLPEVNAVLAEHFAGQPISRQNLSEWRLGGYRDWLKLQQRQLLIRTITEEGASLKQQEADDLYEDFARIAVSELFADMATLDELHGDERWKRLRGLIRELALLQHEYNRSRQVQLAWEKWNGRFEELAEEENPPLEGSLESIRRTEPANDAKPATSVPLAPIGGEGALRGQEAGDQSPSNLPAVKVDQTASNEFHFPWQRREAEMDKLRTYIPRLIHHRRCQKSCLCKTCHPNHSPYPYTEALRDQTEAVGKGVQAFWRGNVMINITYRTCDCPCDCHQTKPLNGSEPATRPIYATHA